jgi:hypothetical protein
VAAQARGRGIATRAGYRRDQGRDKSQQAKDTVRPMLSYALDRPDTRLTIERVTRQQKIVIKASNFPCTTSADVNDVDGAEAFLGRRSGIGR